MEQCLKDYQAYDPLSTVYSDHKIVVTKLRLSLLANGKTTAKRTSFDWHCFSTSHSVREAYTVEVKNRFEALYEIEEKHTVNDLYTTMIEAQMDAAEKCIPKKGRKTCFVTSMMKKCHLLFEIWFYAFFSLSHSCSSLFRITD